MNDARLAVRSRWNIPYRWRPCFVPSEGTQYGRRYWGRSRRSQKRSEEHTSELQSHLNLVCRLLLEKKKIKKTNEDAYSARRVRAGLPGHCSVAYPTSAD